MSLKLKEKDPEICLKYRRDKKPVWSYFNSFLGGFFIVFFSKIYTSLCAFLFLWSSYFCLNKAVFLTVKWCNQSTHISWVVFMKYFNPGAICSTHSRQAFHHESCFHNHLYEAPPRSSTRLPTCCWPGPGPWLDACWLAEWLAVDAACCWKRLAGYTPQGTP